MPDYQFWETRCLGLLGTLGSEEQKLAVSAFCHLLFVVGQVFFFIFNLILSLWRVHHLPLWYTVLCPRQPEGKASWRSGQPQYRKSISQSGPVWLVQRCFSQSNADQWTVFWSILLTSWAPEKNDILFISRAPEVGLSSIHAAMDLGRKKGFLISFWIFFFPKQLSLSSPLACLRFGIFLDTSQSGFDLLLVLQLGLSYFYFLLPIWLLFHRIKGKENF